MKLAASVFFFAVSTTFFVLCIVEAAKTGWLPLVLAVGLMMGALVAESIIVLVYCLVKLIARRKVSA